MNNETLEKMRTLRLFGMYDAFKTNLESSVKEALTADQFISLLVASEWDDRCLPAHGTIRLPSK